MCDGSCLLGLSLSPRRGEASGPTNPDVPSKEIGGTEVTWLMDQGGERARRGGLGRKGTAEVHPWGPPATGHWMAGWAVGFSPDTREQGRGSHQRRLSSGLSRGGGRK